MTLVERVTPILQQWRSRLAALLAVVNAAIVLGRATGLVDWSDAQVVLVMAVTSTTITLIVAVVAHVWPGIAQEPVAIGAAIGAFVPTVLATLNGFGITNMSETVIEAVIAFVVSVGALVGIAVVRQQVAPVGPNIDPDYAGAALPTDRGLPPGG